MGLGMRMGMSGPTLMRYAADKPHNPSSFQGRCRWPSKHTHSQPHSGGIGRRHFHWGTAEHGFFQRLYLLRCEYFCDVRMNGGGDPTPNKATKGKKQVMDQFLHAKTGSNRHMACTAAYCSAQNLRHCYCARIHDSALQSRKTVFFGTHRQ